MAREAEWLGRAVRWRVLARFQGQLMVVVAMLLVPPAAVALVEGEVDFLLRCAVPGVVLLGAGRVLARTRGPGDLQANEGIVLGAGVFVVAAAAMVLPMASTDAPLLDVVFECVSGVTTTGLTTLPSVEGRSAAFLFTRAWMQWFGGLGVAVFAVALLTRPGVAARRLLADDEKQELVGSTRERGARILRVYLLLTAIAWGALVLGGGGWWSSLLYALAAVSTGGFAPHDDSLAGLGGPLLSGLVLAFCVVGGLLHPFYRPARRGRWREVWGDVQVRAFLVLSGALAAALVLTLRLGHGSAWSEAAVEGPILAVTAWTTTGFSRASPAGLDAASKLLVIAAMFVGGGVGSTAGGMKLLRLLVLLRAVQAAVVRTCLPHHAVLEMRLEGERIDERDLGEAVTVAFLLVLFVAASWLLFVMAGYDPLDALFDVTSALGTVGLSAGVVGPDLPGHLKLVLCAGMLLGRLEILAWLVILYPRTWVGRRTQP